jgi:hypothetical protein
MYDITESDAVLSGQSSNDEPLLSLCVGFEVMPILSEHLGY